MRKAALLLAVITIPISLLLVVRPVNAAIDTTRDCDTVAIIKCGSMTVSELQGDAKQGDVPRIFNNFGISQNELNGFIDGVVWKDGRVTLGTRGEGKLVATNAVTAGRWNNPTPDMTRIPDTDRAYRMSTSHFTSDGQISFIKMVNGKFSFAVIKTCGNPVTAKAVTPTPAPKPNLLVIKDVSTMPNGVWQQSVTVKPGDHVRYRIIGKNTGNVTLDRLSVQDVLPAGITEVITPNNTFNGISFTNSVGAGLALPALNPGQQFEIIFEAATDATENRPSACQTGLVNRGIVRTGNVLPDRSDTAVVKVCAPVVATPIYSCNTLQGNTGSNRTFDVSIVGTTAQNGAVLTHIVFDWGDGTTTDRLPNEVSTTVHQYTQDGTYTIKAIPHFTVNGQEVSAPSSACTATVTFKVAQPAVVQKVVQTPPEAPGKLIDTGPGEVLGVLASVITGGMLAYRLVWLRRPV